MWDTFKNLHRDFHERMEQMQKFGGLRILILHVLDENGPGNGVEIMDAIQAHQESCKMSKRQRTPRPSPGSVYPMLKKMVDEDLVIKAEDGRYSLTEKGQNIIDKLSGHLGYHHKMDRGEYSIRKALNEIEGYISYLEDIKEEKLASHEEIIGELAKRLYTVNKSLKKDE
ncbi:MAG: PadR family transcriptional regulator [Methanobacterium sp.]|nr:PadR family transcriptional regulator [Methanobacterium sp.]